MRFGEAVQVEYVDMSDPDSQALFPEVLAAVEERSLPYPLVAVDGRLRAAGSAHYYRVLPYIEEALQPSQVELET